MSSSPVNNDNAEPTITTEPPASASKEDDAVAEAAVVNQENSVNRSTTETEAAAAAAAAASETGPTGCYLVYEPTSGGRLMLQYSQGPIPTNAVGFWAASPSKPIQGFKFKQAGGKSELIKGIAGGDANRRKYFVGWCQFLKLAQQRDGHVICFAQGENQQGVSVDVYGYIVSRNAPVQFDLTRMTSIAEYDAVAVMPKNHEFLAGVKTINQQNFLEKANLAGASTTLK